MNDQLNEGDALTGPGSSLQVLGEDASGLSTAIPIAEELETCPCCGRKPYILLRFPAVEAYLGGGEKWSPLCRDAYEQHLSNAEDTNCHEMEKFGGAYGLVEWEERCVSGSEGERSEVPAQQDGTPETRGHVVETPKN